MTYLLIFVSGLITGFVLFYICYKLFYNNEYRTEEKIEDVASNIISDYQNTFTDIFEILNDIRNDVNYLEDIVMDEELEDDDIHKLKENNKKELQIDQILDKMSKNGYASLSDEEKRILKGK